MGASAIASGQGNTAANNNDNQTNNDDNKSGNNGNTTNDDDKKQANQAQNNQILINGMVQEGVRKERENESERNGDVVGGRTAGGGGPTILAIGASVADKTDVLFDKALKSADALGDDATPGDTIKLQAEYQLASAMSTASSEIVKTTGNSARSGSKTS